MRDIDALETGHAFYIAGREQMDAGHLDAAIAAFQRSIDAQPHFKTLELLGECQLQLGHFKQAVVPLAAATALNMQSRRSIAAGGGIRAARRV